MMANVGNPASPEGGAVSCRSKTPSAMPAALDAVSHASRVEIIEETIMSPLRTGDGPGGMVRALFGDCSLETLDRLCAEAGMSLSDLSRSYRRARAIHAAINSELDSRPLP